MSFVCLLVLPILAPGWSSDSHEVIARIALATTLDARTRDFLERHLVPEFGSTLESALIAASSAPDQWDEWSDRHFSHTVEPSCGQFVLARDCGRIGGPPHCIVTGIAEAFAKSIDTFVSRQERGKALAFLSHFIGDAHQPPHVGFRSDFGGNGL